MTTLLHNLTNTISRSRLGLSGGRSLTFYAPYILNPGKRCK